MLRSYVLLILLTNRIRTAYVTDRPSFADRLDQIYEKLEKFTVTPVEVTKSPREKLYEKLDKLNSLTPGGFSADDEELISSIQYWGKLNAEQLDGVVKDLQSVREEDDRIVMMYSPYGDGDWSEEDEEYPMDDLYNDEEPDPASTSKPVGITPSAFTRKDAEYRDAEYRELLVSAADPIAATNERPKILNSSSLTPAERNALRRAIFTNMATVIRTGKCHDPQPRWLNVRQLAPAANIVYMPPCVLLHRCAPDSGCCHDETEVCAPVAGNHILVPIYLKKANGSMEPARMRFFNHTQCACVSQETLQSTVRTKVETQQKRESQYRKENDYGVKERPPTQEPELERDEPTAPPQLRRCTCPALFMAKITDKGHCSCVCEWPDLVRKRDCLSMARGREHFGLRDRVCVINGDCTPPTCEFGSFERSTGRCPPLKRYRRRYHHGRARLLFDKSIDM
ncbi:uncharacterized protein LOC106132305 [Amyelois transitella]|uniref:uncharacterized protein LOC106132305 n=1 Tax=Amyelois transitella TaxID=680683 RepID=UPI00067DE30A|nr:uncharacterized protein LOC106132305 [Amyelois transitella]